MHFAGGAAQYSEVLTGDMHDAAIDGGASGDDAVGGDVLPVHAEIDGAVAGEESDLLEAIVVHQFADAFAGGELARGMLLLDFVRAAALLDFGPLMAELVELGINGVRGASVVAAGMVNAPVPIRLVLVLMRS
jgi:hypothetical protein